MKHDRITLSHGSGGKTMANLISELFLNGFSNKILNSLNDSAVLNISDNKIAFTTDSYTVKPLFFPGGDIGKLAVCGTVNDLAVMGAKPVALSASFIIEDGFLISDLKKITSSMANTAKECNVSIVTGDTKVVGKGEADEVFINTSGVGIVGKNMNITSSGARVGDKIIISGTIAEHGVSILNVRENLGLRPEIESDVNSIYPLVESCLSAWKYIHVMRDPTRGGLVSVLNEIARASNLGVKIFEKDIPVEKNVSTACEILGLDPLNMANEGKLVMFVDPKKAKDILSKIKRKPFGKKARIIGEAIKGQDVFLETRLGIKRLLPLLEGEALPRIC